MGGCLVEFVRFLQLLSLKVVLMMILTCQPDKTVASFIDPWQFPQGRATWPDAQSPEHGYMRLASMKKILRIRQTIYEDMGNPFADDVERESMSPGSRSRDYRPRPPATVMHGKPSPETPYVEPSTLDDRVSSNDASITTKSTLSYSAYHAPRTVWRKGSAPPGQLLQHGGSVRDDMRDTKFYDFYDDIMQDYQGRDNKL